MRRSHRRLRIKSKLRFALFVIAVVAVLVFITSFALKTESSSEPKKDRVYAVSIPAIEVAQKTQEVYVTPPYSDEEIEMLAKTVYGEAFVTGSETEMSAVVWCVLNRVETSGYGFGNSIKYVITFPGQFSGYNENNPVLPEIELLVRDVLERWGDELNGYENVGRTLPKEYLFFVGDGRTNHYSKEWKSTEYWDWSLSSPYES